MFFSKNICFWPAYLLWFAFVSSVLINSFFKDAKQQFSLFIFHWNYQRKFHNKFIHQKACSPPSSHGFLCANRSRQSLQNTNEHCLHLMIPSSPKTHLEHGSGSEELFCKQSGREDTSEKEVTLEGEEGWGKESVSTSMDEMRMLLSMSLSTKRWPPPFSHSFLNDGRLWHAKQNVIWHPKHFFAFVSSNAHREHKVECTSGGCLAKTSLSTFSVSVIWGEWREKWKSSLAWSCALFWRRWVPRGDTNNEWLNGFL